MRPRCNSKLTWSQATTRPNRLEMSTSSTAGIDRSIPALVELVTSSHLLQQHVARLSGHEQAAAGHQDVPIALLGGEALQEGIERAEVGRIDHPVDDAVRAIRLHPRR